MSLGGWQILTEGSLGGGGWGQEGFSLGTRIEENPFPWTERETDAPLIVLKVTDAPWTGVTGSPWLG